MIGSAASGSGAFPLPEGWTALPNLGTVVEDNTIRDFLGGIVVGVQHWRELLGGAGRKQLGDRPGLRDGLGHRQHIRV